MGSPSKNDDLRSLTKHDTYYIAGGDLCFLVENMCFRVHRYFFERESTYFIGKLAMPASPGQQPQGTQDGNAILLEHVTVEEFARFLWVFYNPRYSLYDATVSDWEIVLKLSVRWGFPEVKNLAVRELEKKEIPDAKRIKLYHANDVDKNILIPRYASLCEREASITLEEGRDLGMETVLMIALGREQARSSRLATGARSPLSPTIHGDELHNVVREIFQIPEPSSNPDKDNTGGLSTASAPPTLKTPLAKKPMAQTATAPTSQANRPRVTKILTQKIGSMPTTVAPRKRPSEVSVAQGSADVIPKLFGDGSPLGTTVDATQGIGGVDDLLGLSNTTFNFMPSTNPRSSSLLDLSPTFAASW